MFRRAFFVLLFFLALFSFLFYRSRLTDAGSRGATPAPPTYRLIDLGVLNTQSGQMLSKPAGINQAGQVAGYSYSGSSLHATRFTHGVVEDLGTLGGDISTGVAVNDLGHVVGDSQYSVAGGSIRRAALFRNGMATDLGFLPGFGNYSRANGINDSDVVVGHSGPSLDTTNTRAFIWDATNGMRDLGTLGGQWAKAFSINDSGVVTGTAQAASGGFRAFIWTQAAGMQDIGVLGGTSSSGVFINNNGHVAGTSTLGNDNRHHAFLYDGSTMRDLGAIGNNDFLSNRSTAYGINIHDHVVGWTYRPYDGGALYQIPFIHRGGQMYDLSTLVDSSGADYRLYVATSISDRGEIAVEALKLSTNQIHAVLLAPNTGRPSFDFDGDGKTDIGIFRPSGGEWWINRSSNGSTLALQFGASTDTITPGDFTGDGKADMAFWRPSTAEWYVLRSEDFSYFSFPFGSNGDRVAPADFDGDGKTDAAVFRPADTNWYMRRSSDGATMIQQFGTSGDVPVAADYDGDGKADIAIYRSSLGQWWLNRSTAGVIAMTFGGAGDKPVQGDYTGDGKTDLAIWRPLTGEWLILRSEDLSYFSFPFGLSTDIPAPGDYDGDGKFDATVFRPSAATWFSQRTTAGTLIQQFGVNGDRPIPNAFVP